MRRTIAALFIGLFAVLAGDRTALASSGGSGGSGARGGSGIVCVGSAPEVLEFYLAGPRRADVSARFATLARDCAGDRFPRECFFGKLLAPLAATRERLALEVGQILREMGPAPVWKRTYSSFGVPQPDLLPVTNPLAQVLREVYRARFGRRFDALTFPSSHAGGTYYFGPDTIFDDALDFDLPPGCSSVQLAVVRGGSRVAELTAEGDRLVADAVQARVLELHEAVYAVALDYGHDSPILTHALGTALITGEGIAAAAERFVAFEAKRARFRARGPEWARIADFGRVDPRPSGAPASDPDFRVFQFDGVDGALEHAVSVRSDGVRIRVRRLSGAYLF